MTTVEKRLTVGGTQVSAVLELPEGAKFLLVLGHGAGAGMRHRSMEEISKSLAAVCIGTFRYNFPYMEAKRGVPDSKPVLFQTIRTAVAEAHRLAPGLPLLAGGKSMGGRMTSMSAAKEPLNSVIGLVFYGFPLHPSGKPSIERAEHLTDVKLPMLFLQGTRDTLADPDLLKPIVESLPSAEAHWVEGADHSFHVLKSTGKTDAQVLQELAETTAAWAQGLSS